jgi:hypothetical protein
LACSSTLMMEATRSSKTLVDIQWTTQCYIPKDRPLYNHHCDNLKFYIVPRSYYTAIETVMQD